MHISSTSSPDQMSFDLFEFLSKIVSQNFKLSHQTRGAAYPVFLPDCAIAGILRCNQRRPPDKRKKGQFSPLLLQGCMRA